MTIKSILTAFTVNLGLICVQPVDLILDPQTFTREVNSASEIRKNFQNLFDSIIIKNSRKSQTYHDMLKQEVYREQRDFDALKEDLRIARNTNSKGRRRIYGTSGNGGTIVASKRETNVNNLESHSSSSKSVTENEKPWKDIFEACELNDLEAVRNFVEVQGIPVTSVNHDHETPAHSAAKKCHMPVLKYLLEKQPDLRNARDTNGNNILHLATLCGSLDLVKYLVAEHGMDVYEPASAHLGNGAVHLAAYAGWLPLLRYFFEEKMVDPNLRNRLGQPVAFAAAQNRKLRVIKYLLEERNANFFLTDQDNNNILLISVNAGDLSIPVYLLEEKKMKFDVEWKDRFGRTVLHHAARRNQLVIVKYFVMEKNADFNEQDSMGRSPLHEAAEKNNLAMVKYLMERGASVFVQDNLGKTPLQVTKDKHVIMYLEQYVPPE